MSSKPRVGIIGGGLSGLCCARSLVAAGAEVRILEASNDVGGRVRTDIVDGFRLDRGFQVLQTAYPEAQRVLDYEALRLRPFAPGALIRTGRGLRTMADPWRAPSRAFGTLFNGIGTLADRWRLASLRRRVTRTPVEDLWFGDDTPTNDYLRSTCGFSEDIVERFLRPWFAGVFLDRKLETSRRFFEFTFRMFAVGDAALPEEGMQAIPRQLAAGLPDEAIALNTPVQRIEGTTLHTANGGPEGFDAVVVATEAPAAGRLLGEEFAVPASRSTTCLYFATDHPPIDEPMLVLDGEGRGPVNNCCVPSNVAPTYAPAGASLVSASVIGRPRGDDLETEVRSQLRRWFGGDVDGWRTLGRHDIAHALPAQPAGRVDGTSRDVRFAPGVYLCGDHCHTASINGAMLSGRTTAAAVVADLESHDDS